MVDCAKKVAVLGVFASLAACSTLSPPFDKMKDSQMTVYRLQNYEPPPATTSSVPSGTAALPPQIQQWLQAGAALLPPNLLPPGLLQTAQPPAEAQTPRFHGFRILGYQQISDSKLKSDIVDIFGTESNFTEKHDNCMYAEFGFAMAQPSSPTPADVLVSLSCQQVQGFNFAWPYTKAGLKDDTQKKIASVVQRAFGPQ